jgi:hypothetical protein
MDDLLSWNGNRYFHSGVSTFWKIANLASDAAPEQLLFSEWQDYWGEPSEMVWSAARWKRPPEAAPSPHAQTPADYELDDAAADNPARGGASDGLDAGFIAARLPPLPLDLPADLPPAN